MYEVLQTQVSRWIPPGGDAETSVPAVERTRGKVTTRTRTLPAKLEAAFTYADAPGQVFRCVLCISNCDRDPEQGRSGRSFAGPRRVGLVGFELYRADDPSRRVAGSAGIGNWSIARKEISSFPINDFLLLAIQRWSSNSDHSPVSLDQASLLARAGQSARAASEERIENMRKACCAYLSAQPRQRTQAVALAVWGINTPKRRNQAASLIWESKHRSTIFADIQKEMGL